MEFRLEQLIEKKLIGKRLRMSLSNNRTVQLWQSFMPQRKTIKNNLGTALFSLQVYEPSLNFAAFNLETEFEKWALIEVADFSDIPEGMETFTLPGGLYAVFVHRGLDFQPTFHKIFNEWLPHSDYIVDQRPHFEWLGPGYKNNSEDSEEEVWIPVRSK